MARAFARRRSTCCIAVSFLAPVEEVEVPTLKSEAVLLAMRGSRFGIFGGLPGPFRFGVEAYFLNAGPCSPSIALEYGSVPLSEESLGVTIACFANLPGAVSCPFLHDCCRERLDNGSSYLRGCCSAITGGKNDAIRAL